MLFLSSKARESSLNFINIIFYTVFIKYFFTPRAFCRFARAYKSTKNCELRKNFEDLAMKANKIPNSSLH